MRTRATAAIVGLGLLAGTAASGHAQNYNYYGAPSTYTWPPYNYPRYQARTSGNPWYYYYPGYDYAYDYPTYNYAGSAYPAPKAYWDPYVALRPYSDNAGPKASGHGSP